MFCSCRIKNWFLLPVWNMMYCFSMYVISVLHIHLVNLTSKSKYANINKCMHYFRMYKSICPQQWQQWHTIMEMAVTRSYIEGSQSSWQWTSTSAVKYFRLLPQKYFKLSQGRKHFNVKKDLMLQKWCDKELRKVYSGTWTWPTVTRKRTQVRYNLLVGVN